MSHIASIECELRSLEAIKSACARLGWTFKEGQTSYKWFGQWMGDSPVPEQLFSPEEANAIKEMPTGVRSDFLTDLLGSCDHAIEVPGARYSIGLIKRGEKYLPVWDYWQSGGLQGVTPENGMAGFVQAYVLECAKLQALAMGQSYQEEVLQDGTIKARIVALG
jgi:hypothetical protein